MEKIKYQIQYVSGSSYNLKFLLIQEYKDLGYFDVYDDPLSNVTVNPYFNTTKIVTGFTKNKLEILRTYSVSNLLSKKYKTSTSVSVNGLDLSLTSSGTTLQRYVYYVDKITYITTVSGSNETTIYSYITSGDSNTINFIRKPIIKDELKINQINSPQIESEIFLDRQILSVFENNYKLSNINNISQLIQYGGGYFNIIENT